jgi:hypothetical protein
VVSSIEILTWDENVLTASSHQTFTHLLHNPSSSSSTNSPLTPSTHNTRRLHRTRQNLGSHRHDLLVALRVVNRIEKEVVEAEYENWLLDETHKCDRVGALIVDSGEGKGKEVEAWVSSYCGDCRSSLQVVKEARKGLM